MNFKFRAFFLNLLSTKFYFTADEFIQLRDYRNNITIQEYRKRHSRNGYVDYKSKRNTYRIFFKDSGNFLTFYDIKENPSLKQNNPWD